MELLVLVWLLIFLCIFPFLIGLVLHLISRHPVHRRTARYLVAFACVVFVALIVFPWLKIVWQSCWLLNC